MQYVLADAIVSIKYDVRRDAIYALGKKHLFVKGTSETSFKSVMNIPSLNRWEEFRSFASHGNSIAVSILDTNINAVGRVCFKDDVTNTFGAWRQTWLPNAQIKSIPLAECNMCSDGDGNIYLLDDTTGNVIYTQDLGRSFNTHNAITDKVKQLSDPGYKLQAIQVGIPTAEKAAEGQVSFFVGTDQRGLHVWPSGAEYLYDSNAQTINCSHDPVNNIVVAIYDSKGESIPASFMDLFHSGLTRAQVFLDSTCGYPRQRVSSALAISGLQIVQEPIALRSFYATNKTRESLQQVYWFSVDDRNRAAGLPTSIPPSIVHCAYQLDGLLYIGTDSGIMAYKESDIAAVKSINPAPVLWRTTPVDMWCADSSTHYGQIVDMYYDPSGGSLLFSQSDYLDFPWNPYPDNKDVARMGTGRRIIRRTKASSPLDGLYSVTGKNLATGLVYMYASQANGGTINALWVDGPMGVPGHVNRWETSFSGLLTAMPQSKSNMCVDEDGYLYLMDVPTGNIIYSDYNASKFQVHDKLTNAVRTALQGYTYELLNLKVSTRFGGNGLSAFVGTSVGDVIIYGDKITIQQLGLRTRNYAYDPVYDNLIAFHYDEKMRQVSITQMKMLSDSCNTWVAPYAFSDTFPEQSVPLAVSTLDQNATAFYAGAQINGFDDLHRVYRFFQDGKDLKCVPTNIQPFPINGMLQINGYAPLLHQLCIYTATDLWLTYDENAVIQDIPSAAGERAT